MHWGFTKWHNAYAIFLRIPNSNFLFESYSYNLFYGIISFIGVCIVALILHSDYSLFRAQVPSECQDSPLLCISLDIYLSWILFDVLSSSHALLDEFLASHHSQPSHLATELFSTIGTVFMQVCLHSHIMTSFQFLLGLMWDPNPSVEWTEPFRPTALVTVEMPWKVSFPARMSDVGRGIGRNFPLFLEINHNCS